MSKEKEKAESGGSNHRMIWLIIGGFLVTGVLIAMLPALAPLAGIHHLGMSGHALANLGATVALLGLPVTGIAQLFGMA